MNGVKGKIYNIIRDDDENNLLSNIVDSIIIFMIIINVVAVIADTFTLPPHFQTASWIIEIVTVVVFSIEYLLRLWTSDLRYSTLSPIRSRIRYILSFMAIIDLLAILPFYIPFLFPIDLRVLRTLRVVRLFRLFKVNRYTHALSTIGTVFKKKSGQLLSSIFVVTLLMVIASVLMYNVESEAQPDKFDNVFSALWWAVATFTTVGYGDIFPITVLGKFLSAVIAFLGIGLVAVPTGIISAGFIEQLDVEKKQKEHPEEKCFCPYCGKNIHD